MKRPEPTPEAGAHLLDYVRVLLKRIWLILGIFVTVVAVVLFATYRATPMFRATAVINIRQPNQIMGRLDPSELIRSVSNSEVYMNTRYALLASRSTAEKMVTKHRLQDWPEFRGVKEQQIVRAITGNVEVEPRRSTSLVRVSVVNANPTLAMKLANKLVETFKYLQEGEAASDVEDKIDKVESKWLGFQQKGSLEQGGLRTLMQENNTDLETFLENYEYKRDRLRKKKELIDQEKENLATKRPFYERIVKVRKAGNGHDDGFASLFSHPALRKDETIRITEQTLAVLTAELTHLMRDLGQGEKFEAVAEKRREIDQQQAILEHEKKMFLLGYVASYEELTQVIEALEEQLEEIEAEFRLLSALKREYDEKTDRIARYKTEEDRYFALLEKLQDARTDKYHPVTIAQTASEPIAPFKPDRQLNLILGVVFGLLGGLGVAFFLEYLDDTIKTKEELERITRTQLFGVIPHMPVRKRSDVSGRDLFVYAEPKSTIAEAFRGIRTALAYSSQKGENQVYLVTSAGPKEGKSTIAINLATVMAFDDTKTVLVDADLRRPRVHRSFGLQNDRGLSNLIIGDSSIEDVVQPTGLENLGNLSVLPSGPIPPNPSELLGRDRVTEILLQLRERYDRVLIDSPPVGAVTDAVVLGRIVDTVILVVHAGRTRKKLVERGLEQLGQVEVDVAGVVLNNLKISRKRYYPGYYHYYYYYSSYYGAEEKPVSRRPDKESTGA